MRHLEGPQIGLTVDPRDVASATFTGNVRAIQGIDDAEPPTRCQVLYDEEDAIAALDDDGIPQIYATGSVILVNWSQCARIEPALCYRPRETAW